MNEYNPLGIGIDTAINLLAEVFGIHYIIPGAERDSVMSGYPGATYEADALYSDADGQLRYSQFGTPVLGDFWAIAGDIPYLVYDTKGKLVKAEFSEFEFPLATIVDFSRPKNITKTPTIGGGGTVKEIFGYDDWKINIRGICMYDSSRQAQKTADEQQKALIKLNKIAGSIKIDGKIFAEKDISRIAIESLSITPVQGKPGLIQYEMECSSDEDFLISEV